MAEARCLEVRMCVAEDDSEALRVVYALVNWLTAERESLNARTEQEMEELDPLAACITKLGFAASTRDKELGVVVQALWSLKGRVAAGKDKANTV